MCGSRGWYPFRNRDTEDVRQVEKAVEEAKTIWNRARKVLIGGFRSAKGVLNALDICNASNVYLELLSGGDYTKIFRQELQVPGWNLGARQHMIIAARAAGVQCFDTVCRSGRYGRFQKDVETIH